MNQTYYADSSVLVKRHIREVGTPWVLILMHPSENNIVFTSLLSKVEVLSAFNRQRREASISVFDYNQISAAFVGSSSEYRFIKLEQSIIAETQRLLEEYPLRAGDAVQLASAVVVRTSLLNAGLQEPIFLASDNKLLDAAIGEGFTTDNPLLHP